MSRPALLAALVALALALGCGVKGYPRPPRPDADQPAAATPAPGAPQCTSCAAPDGGAPEPR